MNTEQLEKANEIHKQIGFLERRIVEIPNNSKDEGYVEIIIHEKGIQSYSCKYHTRYDLSEFRPAIQTAVHNLLHTTSDNLKQIFVAEKVRLEEEFKNL